MIEKWEERVDNGELFGALMTDLYKAFDCWRHELLIAKPVSSEDHINNLCK